jgi:hypothetical protein
MSARRESESEWILRLQQEINARLYQLEVRDQNEGYHEVDRHAIIEYKMEGRDIIYYIQQEMQQRQTNLQTVNERGLESDKTDEESEGVSEEDNEAEEEELEEQEPEDESVEHVGDELDFPDDDDSESSLRSHMDMRGAPIDPSLIKFYNAVEKLRNGWKSGGISDTYGEIYDYEFTYRQLVRITDRPFLRDMVCEALRERAEHITELSFVIGDESLNEAEEQEVEVEVEYDDLKASARLVGRRLLSLTSLTTVYVKLGRFNMRASQSIVAEILGCCPKAERLIFDLRRYIDWQSASYNDDVLAFTAGVRGSPLLKTVIITRYEEFDTMKYFIEPLLTLQNLEIVQLRPSRRQEIHISRNEDAKLFRQLLTVSSLKWLDTGRVILDTDEAADTVVGGIAASSMAKLHLRELSFPKNKQAQMADALVNSKVEELSLFPHKCGFNLDFFRIFGLKLRQSKTTRLRKLTLGGGTDQPAGVIVTAFLQHAPHWKLCEARFVFRVEHWTKSLENALASYISGSSCLRYLRITVSGGERLGGSGLKSQALLDAALLGNGSLDEIDLYINDGWNEKINKCVALNSNRLKRIHGPAFQALYRVTDRPTRQHVLVRAMASVDHVTLWAFLQGNEYQCRDELLKEVPLSRKRTRSPTALSSEV